MNARILIVEDDDMNRDMLSRRLQLHGYRVISAGDGVEGIARAAEEAPDLILMDMSLPDMSGWEATRHLKADPLTRAIPVIALTAHAMVEDRSKALQAGCDDYETKPIDFPRLMARMNSLLSQEAIR